MPLRYTIEPIPTSGTYIVELELIARAEELLLRLPVWLPGSYMIRDMAAEIQSIKVTSGRQTLVSQKIDKSTWIHKNTS